MKKQSALEKCSDNDLFKELDNNNSQLSKINNILKNYDNWIIDFKKIYDSFKKNCEVTRDFAHKNIKLNSKTTREMNDFFFSREVFSLDFNNKDHKKMYFEQIKVIIDILMLLKEPNKLFQDHLVPAGEKESEVYIGDYFSAHVSEPNSDKLLWPIPYHSAMFYNPVKQGKDMELYKFEESIEEIIRKLHKPFKIINIPKKEVFKNEIEKFTKNNRQIELILRSRKKRTEKLENVGYVYVLSNEAYPNIYKIGSTYGLPEERAEELTGTGHLTPFKVVGKIKVQSAEYYEKSIHKLLKEYRVKQGREFFKLDLDKIKQCLKQISQISDKGVKKISLASLQKEIKF